MNNDVVVGWVIYNPCGIDNKSHICNEETRVRTKEECIKELKQQRKEYDTPNLTLCKVVVEDY